MGSKALLHCSCGSVRAMPLGVVRSRLRRSLEAGVLRDHAVVVADDVAMWATGFVVAATHRQTQ
jgi:hypothetical protein